jgi:CheY-like chemotaxis protein
MSSQRILVVDDSPDIRQITKLFLHSFGYEVLEAENGTAAIENAVAEDPALILLDCLLPETKGLEVARALQKLPQTADIPIIGWTSDPTATPSKEELQQAGFVAWLVKPISFVALEALVERFVPRPERRSSRDNSSNVASLRLS